MVGIAKASQSSSSGNWTNNNNSPVCVDDSPYDVWSSWNASQRDLFVLDLNGDLVLHQNITSGVPDNLESLIIDLLGQSGTDLCNINYTYVSEAQNAGNPVDYIEIYNSGENDCSLEGFKLDNSQDMADLIFENVVVPASGYWLGYKGSDSSFSFDLNNVGDEVWLSDPLGNTKVISLSASVELDGVQLSQSFSSDGFGCYTSPTPGENNADCITLEIDVQNTPSENILLSNNYPNPFNPNTYIPIEMKNSENIIIEIYDVRGNLVNTLFSGFLERGTHNFRWNALGTDGIEVGSGVYFSVVKSKNIFLSKKIIFAK
ncbi:MAG: lamin tail domain-containing protein [Candidatus Neomarinimicrobiota bacterium]